MKEKLETDLAKAVRGSLNRNEHSPFHSLQNLDWPCTISRNLKNYDPTLKTIIPEQMS